MNQNIFMPKGNNFAQAAAWTLRQYGVDVPKMQDRRYNVSIPGPEKSWERWGITYCRDGDIPRLVSELGGMGLVGSDVLVETKAQALSRLDTTKVGPIADREGRVLRFGLFALQDRSDEVSRMIEQGRTVRIGTSYPGFVGSLAMRSLDMTQVCSGSAEALPRLFQPGRVPNSRAVDAIVELYQSGRTIRQNELVEVACPPIQQEVELIEVRSKTPPQIVPARYVSSHF